MKVYTRKGDEGKTSLIGGTRVAKNHVRIEAYGTVDELNSLIGLLRDPSVEEILQEDIIEIQDRLFTLGSLLAADPGNSKMKLPEIHQSDIDWLEQKMDKMNETLEEMRSFVLPGGHPMVSHAHVARCVCRRAERAVLSLSEKEAIPEKALPYLNRLSDYLFVLSRKLTKDHQVAEIPWKPRM